MNIPPQRFIAVTEAACVSHSTIDEAIESAKKQLARRLLPRDAYHRHLTESQIFAPIYIYGVVAVVTPPPPPEMPAPSVERFDVK